MNRHDRASNDERLDATPRIERLLASLRARLRGQIWLHGVGTVLGVLALWLVFAFVADWGLRVPRAVRTFHGIVVFGLLGYFTWRQLLRPLGRIPGRAGLAVLLERAYPELQEMLISAVQLQRAPADEAGDPELVSRVLAGAEARADGLDTRRVIEPSQPRARFLLGTGTALGLAIALALNPTHAEIFFSRLFGGTRAWPQRTHLAVDVPVDGTGVQVTRTPELIHARVARGTDVPVLVEADGVVPDEVVLHFDVGRDLVLGSTSAGVFRTLLRSCQEDLTFWASGGDDDDGLPRVFVEVLQPPDVEGLAVTVRPPAYSGVPESVVFDRDVEVLAGSELVVHVLPFPAHAEGVARLLPDDVAIPLTSSPYPRDPRGGDDVVARDGLAFALTADKTLGFRIELSDDSGLSNPDPGLFRVRVLEDRPPEVQVLAPARSSLEVVKGGALPLRARAQDDFGLVSMGWTVHADDGGEHEPVLQGTFELLDVASPNGDGAATGEPALDRRRGRGSVRIEVDELGTQEAPVSVDQRFSLTVTATDNREPEAGAGNALPVRVRVVTPEELLRRMQERLAQARLSALRLADLQREKRRRVEELVDVFSGDDARASGDDIALAAALGGQRRAHGDAQALAQDLVAVAEDVLYGRLDEKAGGLLAFLDARLAEVGDAAFHAEPWRELAVAHASGQLGATGFAGNLVELVAVALEIEGDHTRGAVDALVRAEQAIDAARTQEALVEAIDSQTKALARMDALLEQLAEWDNFQNILALTRDILNRQKALRERTQQFASDK